jgi:hypothetical protein
MKYLAVFALVLSYNTHATDLTLKTYESDGCTMFPDGSTNNKTLWRHCCDLHDLRYWFGGTKDNELQADLNLKSCVDEVAGPVVANMMYLGVRTGHYSPIKNKYKWGWGWGSREEWLPLTADEKIYISTELDYLNLEGTVREKLRTDYSL